MNIRDFQYIVAVDELKSFINASVRCFVSQPALSMQIQKTEEVLGVKIFERTRKSVITTKEGEKVVGYAKIILKTYETIKMIRHERNQLNIGIIPTVAPYLLPKIMPKMKMDLKNINISFMEDKTEELKLGLKNGDFDGIVIASNESCNRKLNLGPNIVMNNLYKERFFVAMSKDHQFVPADKKITSDEFKKLIFGEAFILLEDGNCLTDTIEEICLRYKIELKAKSTNLVTSNIETIKKMIIGGNGFSILPMLSICHKDDVDGIKYYEMPENEHRGIFLCFRKNSSKMQSILDISTIIKQEV